MAQALFVHGSGDLRVGTCKTTCPSEGEVQVALRRGGICGSDLHYFNHGGFGTVRLREPMILGHEVAGEITEIGPEVTGLAVGDLVAISPSRPVSLVLSVGADCPINALTCGFTDRLCLFPISKARFEK